MVARNFQNYPKPMLKIAARTHTNTLISGHLLFMFAQCLYAGEVLPIVEKYQPQPIDPKKWYPAVLTQHILVEIERYSDGSEMLFALGQSMAELLSQSVQTASLESVLSQLPVLYASLHQYLPADRHWQVQLVGRKHIHVTNHTSLPVDLAYGLLWSLTDSYKPASNVFSIQLVSQDRSTEYAIQTFGIRWGTYPDDL
jgi:hypothetical protein